MSGDGWEMDRIREEQEEAKRAEVPYSDWLAAAYGSPAYLADMARRQKSWAAEIDKRWERKEVRHIPDDDKRDDFPLYSGLLAYFPAALMEVARWSKVGNDKHNPGEKLHWSREKSTDHEDKIVRHLLDARVKDKNGFYEATALAWRALALLQTILEEEEGRPEGANSKRTSNYVKYPAKIDPWPGSLDDLREERSKQT